MYVRVFFFKQKTAYEMRISDWSSDVCSSDLNAPAGNIADDVRRRCHRCAGRANPGDGRRSRPGRASRGHGRPNVDYPALSEPDRQCPEVHRQGSQAGYPPDRSSARRRSAEHTSELQSLMRISYAVFCLKKNKKTN